MIADIGHIALQVVDLDASVEFATGVLGMHEVERNGDTAYLTLRSPYPSKAPQCPHHVLEYRKGPTSGLDHIGLIARDRAALDEVRRSVEAHGGTIVGDGGDEPWLDASFRVAAPSGHVFEIYHAMKELACDYSPRGVAPHRLGHIAIQTTDLGALTRFSIDGLGFKVSDLAGTHEAPIVSFLRCHFEHHTLNLLPGPAEGFHHFAFEVGGMPELSLLGDHLARRGAGYMWGPTRHGAGDNIAAYMVAPNGIIVETYADMMKIVGDAWEPRCWDPADPRSGNIWAPPGVTPGGDLGSLMTYGLPLVHGS